MSRFLCTTLMNTSPTEYHMATQPTTLMAQEGLLDTAGIASLLGCTREHATDRIIKKVGFPKPRINLSQKLRRWDKDEVMVFLTKKKHAHS